MASPKGPANIKSKRHPLILIKAINPVAIFLTTMTIVSITFIKISNIVDINFARAYKPFPAIFF